MINRVSGLQGGYSQRHNTPVFGTAFKITQADSASPVIERISQEAEIEKLNNYAKAFINKTLAIVDASLAFDDKKKSAFIKTELASSSDKLKLEIQTGIHKPYLNIISAGEEESVKYRFVKDKTGPAAEACNSLLTALGLPL